MPQTAPRPIVIRSEADAWKYLDAALKGDLPETTKIVFQGYPKLHISLDVGDASIRPTLMRAFVDFQEALWRSHALLTHGEANISFLTDAEKASLELDVLVRPGSSGFFAPAEEALKQLADTVGNKMSGKQSLIAVMFFTTCYFGSTTWKAYFDGRIEEHKAVMAQEERLASLQAQVKLSEEETERMKLLDSAYKKIAALKDVAEEADRARTSFAKHVPPEATADLQGTVVTGSVANELAKKPRESLAENQIEETFSVQHVDTRKADGFRVRLRNLATGGTFTADLPDDISPDTQRVIERATFDKKPVIATVEIFKQKRKIVRARIIKAIAAPADARVDLASPKKAAANKKKG